MAGPGESPQILGAVSVGRGLKFDIRYVEENYRFVHGDHVPPYYFEYPKSFVEKVEQLRKDLVEKRRAPKFAIKEESRMMMERKSWADLISCKARCKISYENLVHTI